MMAKSKRLTVRLNHALDAVINQACIDGNCDKSTVVINAIKKGLEVDDEEVTEERSRRKGNLAGSEPYDIYNKDSGCISRYRANGELMFHWKPAEVVNGVQYYRDTIGSDPDRKWYKDKEGSWVQIVRVR